MNPFSVKVTIQSDTRYIALLRQLVAAAADIVGKKSFPRQAVRDCTLALIEAVDNAIFHAHRRHTRLPIAVRLDVGGGVVKMRITDCGVGLDHNVVHAPVLSATRGRGLYMIDRLVDSVESKKTKDGHELVLKYNII